MWATLSVLCAGLAVLLAALILLAPWAGAQRPAPARDLPWAWRAAWPWLAAVSGRLHSLLGWRRRGVLQQAILRAGYAGTLMPAHIAAAQCLAGASAGGGILALTWALGFSSAAVAWLAGAGACIAAMLPGAWLSERKRARARRMNRELPFLLDMITLCMDAGLNVQGALQQAVERGPPGPLRDEFHGALSEVRAGVGRLEALHALAARSGLPALQGLVSAIAQADTLGMSLAPVLQAQSERQRAERLLRAEQLALEAPVKMLFPLIVCIFPCTFLVLGFPIGQRLLQASF